MLVYGYGNPGRQDDGLGPEVAERVERLGLPGVDTDANYQLNIEDAATLAGYDRALFVDASRDAAEPYQVRRIEPASDIAFTSHSVSAESILAVCEEHFGGVPETWMLGIRGYEWEFAEGLSPKARENCEQAVAFVQQWAATWRDCEDGSERSEEDHSHH